MFSSGGCKCSSIPTSEKQQFTDHEHNSLQLQLGIIAGCAPALKPLFGRLLGTSNASKGKYYGQSSRSRHNMDPGLRTIGGSGAPRSANRTKNGGADYMYELDEQSLDGSASSQSAGKAGHNTTIEGGVFYKNREGSQDRILEDGRLPAHPANGVMMTTEVIVK